ncbi:P-loop NTPase fold protein [Bradyrhizobium elkanii]
MTKDAVAREYLDYYLSLTGDPEFAVMLEGPWGSGKSFFVDHYFKDRLAKLREKDPEAKEEIRLTLFGVREFGEITSQIFAKIHPMLGGKVTKFLNVVGSKAVSYLGVSTNPEDNAKLLQEMMLNLDGRVLVFDDFERCPLSVVEVMGFINRFVERDKVKVIVIASEADIDPSQKDEYGRRKEKLIGKTIRVGSDAGIVLDTFTAKLTSPEARAAIAANRDAALATFTACDRPNFRSLRSILSDYDRLVTLADPKLAVSADALGALLLYMIAVGVEYRNGGIDIDGVRNLSTDLAFRLNSSKMPIPEEQSRAQRLRTQYQLVSWRDPVVSPELLAELFGSGTIEVDKLNQYILSHPRVVGRAQVPAWRAMWSWYDMGFREYQPVRNEFVDQLANRKLTHPGEILHAAGTSIRLLGCDDDVLGGVNPKQFFEAYLADLEKDDRLIASPQLFGLGTGGYDGLVYNEHDNPAFIEI